MTSLNDMLIRRMVTAATALHADCEEMVLAAPSWNVLFDRYLAVKESIRELQDCVQGRGFEQFVAVPEKDPAQALPHLLFTRHSANVIASRMHRQMKTFGDEDQESAAVCLCVCVCVCVTQSN
eukprot:GHVR01175212.1.p1 GENE.GHVR01175212.1~~GHVR01175212.1.p1  ORF type:complete len:123 (-),score=31.21 GHVR01175212.1:486-854(-)